MNRKLVLRYFLFTLASGLYYSYFVILTLKANMFERFVLFESLTAMLLCISGAFFMKGKIRLAGLIGVYGTGMGMSNILSYWFLMGRLIQSKFLLFGMVFLITTTSLITLLTVLAFRALNAPKTNFAVNKLMRISAWIPSVILLSIIAIVTYLQSKDLFAVANLFN